MDREQPPKENPSDGRLDELSKIEKTMEQVMEKAFKDEIIENSRDYKSHWKKEIKNMKEQLTKLGKEKSSKKEKRYQKKRFQESKKELEAKINNFEEEIEKITAICEELYELFRFERNMRLLLKEQKEKFEEAREEKLKIAEDIVTLFENQETQSTEDYTGLLIEAKDFFRTKGMFKMYKQTEHADFTINCRLQDEQMNLVLKANSFIEQINTIEKKLKEKEDSPHELKLQVKKLRERFDEFNRNLELEKYDEYLQAEQQLNMISNDYTILFKTVSDDMNLILHLQMGDLNVCFAKKLKDRFSKIIFELNNLMADLFNFDFNKAYSDLKIFKEKR
ncbi:MAG: hypothetical protein GF347_00455 [Candidatus Moranbacteria bacterium]|nr:hypothetical protein [Candidatus Moranbacteria bacterium]